MLNKKSLKKQTLYGIVWRGSSDILKQILQIVFTMILARLLTKGDFGLVAMVMLVNRFVVSMTNIGFGGAIVQSQTVTKNQISAVFYIQLVINMLLTVVVFFSAGLASSFFKAPELVPLIKVCAFAIVLQSLQFPNILLRKALKFKNYSLIEISAMVVANSIAIVLAIQGFGVWALVWRLMVQRILFGLLSFYYGKWLPLTPEFKGIKPLFKYGINMLGSNMGYYFAENLIAILTGKYLGKETLGLFNIAYNLAIVPASKIKTVITTVLTASFSKLQFETDKFSSGFNSALKYIALVFIPVMLFISASSYNTIPLFYGDEWKGASPFLLLLSFVGIFRGISHVLRSAIQSKGKTKIILHATIIELFTSLPIMYVAMSKYGIYGLITGYLLGAMFGFIYIVVYYDKMILLQYASYKALKNGVIIGSVIFMIVYFQSYLMLPNIFSVIIQALSSLIVFLVLFKVFENQNVLSLLKNKMI